jgi:hypothetical protein
MLFSGALNFMSMETLRMLFWYRYLPGNIVKARKVVVLLWIENAGSEGELNRAVTPDEVWLIGVF